MCVIKYVLGYVRETDARPMLWKLGREKDTCTDTQHTQRERETESVSHSSCDEKIDWGTSRSLGRGLDSVVPCYSVTLR